MASSTRGPVVKLDTNDNFKLGMNALPRELTYVIELHDDIGAYGMLDRYTFLWLKIITV